jgi:hypothetical protein
MTEKIHALQQGFSRRRAAAKKNKAINAVTLNIHNSNHWNKSLTWLSNDLFCNLQRRYTIFRRQDMLQASHDRASCLAFIPDRGGKFRAFRVVGSTAPVVHHVGLLFGLAIWR